MAKLSFLHLCLFLLLAHFSVAYKLGFHGRIIGGQTANALQFPYSAAIYKTTSDSKHFCSGTLLSNSWILTAGQCVDGALSFTILLGTLHLNVPDEGSIELATSSFVLHPDFNAETLENDMGLIKLRMPITFTEYIKPVERLPLSEIPGTVRTAVYGWGQTSDSDSGFSNALQWVAVATITNEECSTIYGGQILDSMVCAEGNFNEGICYGDIGSPLIQYYSTGHAIPVAIASFVSGNGCESTNPSGFTRVFPHNAWIRDVTQLNI